MSNKKPRIEPKYTCFIKKTKQNTALWASKEHRYLGSYDTLHLIGTVHLRNDIPAYMLSRPCHETLHVLHTVIKGTDQRVHPCSLISAFVIGSLESITA